MYTQNTKTDSKGAEMPDGLSESRFNMWRAVAAMMHIDQVVRPHEINFILEGTKNVPMTGEQRATLSSDLKQALSIDDVFHKITHPVDKEDFFHLARAIAWSDGDFDEKERSILQRLGAVQFNGNDENLMQDSLKSFEEIYLGKTASLYGRDKSVVDLVRQFMGAGR